MDDAVLHATPEVPAPRPGERGLWAQEGRCHLLVVPFRDPPWWEPKSFATPAEAYAHAVGLLEASGGVEWWELCLVHPTQEVRPYLGLPWAPVLEGGCRSYRGPMGPYARTFLVEVHPE